MPPNIVQPATWAWTITRQVPGSTGVIMAVAQKEDSQSAIQWEGSSHSLSSPPGPREPGEEAGRM
jgi:hypothetical protein